MKFPTTGIILASGEGSRLKEQTKLLGVPKHLFPIGNSNIVNRLAQQFSLSCQEIICITSKEHQQIFQNNFKTLPFAVKVISKEEPGFKGDFLATTNAQNHHIILTMGDLIFPDGEINSFVYQTQNNNKKNQAVICLDRQQIKKIDLRIVMCSYPKTLLEKIIPLNPESLLSVGTAFLKNFFQGNVTLNLATTLFNINTEDSYHQANTFFQK
ncbi:MAG: NTP transferase domain-containing protein [Oligoflexia bacterium]|nr:NTP transferase domain-containing protein [Oligoflexia bacterium]